MDFEVVEDAPRAEEYCQLRLAAGLSQKSLSAAQVGLKNALYSICIRSEGRLIGMGRVIGDGACFFQIVDIAVDPSYQGGGLGKQIMSKIDGYLLSVVQAGSYVSLIADKPGFYEKLGYKHTAPEGYGMYKLFS